MGNALQIEEYGVSYPMMAMDVSLFKDDATIKSAAASCGSEDANLQDVTPYCDVGLVVMDDAGEYHFMSVKNNAYSNRSQKGTIIVEDGVASTATTLASSLVALPSSVPVVPPRSSGRRSRRPRAVASKSNTLVIPTID